jgi:hypothetical protein
MTELYQWLNSADAHFTLLYLVTKIIRPTIKVAAVRIKDNIVHLERS